MRIFPALALAICAPSVIAADSAPDFSKDVRPILSRFCFKCHGPDDKARKSELRVDRREYACQPAESGERAIVPGKTEQSELVKRIFSEDPEETMPPRAAKLSLSDGEKQILKRWI